MPTLEVQLAKALKELDRLGKGKWEVNGRYWAEYGKRADQVHGDDAELRGLMERVRHLQQRIAVRNERAEQHAAALTLVQLAQTYESVDLPVHTSVPTAPE
jgi:hypothetical protein